MIFRRIENQTGMNNFNCLKTPAQSVCLSPKSVVVAPVTHLTLFQTISDELSSGSNLSLKEMEIKNQCKNMSQNRSKVIIICKFLTRLPKIH